MAEFMRQNARKLAQAEPSRLGQAYGEDQIMAQETKQTAAKSRGGIQLAIDIDPRGNRSTHRLTQFGDEGEHERLCAGIQRQRFGAWRTSGQQRFDHEKHHHSQKQSTSPFLFTHNIALLIVRKFLQ